MSFGEQAFTLSSNLSNCAQIAHGPGAVSSALPSFLQDVNPLSCQLLLHPLFYDRARDFSRKNGSFSRLIYS